MSNDGKQPPNEPGGKTEAPEVEAEIVDQGGAPKASPPDDAAAPDKRSADADSPGKAEPDNFEPETGQANPEQVESDDLRSRGVNLPDALTPGLMLFVAFVAFVLVILSVWYFSGRGAPTRDDPPPTVSSVEESAANPIILGTDDISEKEPASAADPSADEPLKTADDTVLIDDNKIANANARIAKTFAGKNSLAEEATGSDVDSNIDPVDPEAPRSEALSTASGGVNAGLQSAAKDALRNFGKEAETPSDPSVDAPENAEISSGYSASPLTSSETDPAPSDALSLGPSEQSDDAPPPAASKIANDMSVMKQSFEEQLGQLNSELDRERNNGQQQAAEIQALRDDLQNTLIERDRRAGAEVADLKARLEKIQNTDVIAEARRAGAFLALVSLQRAFDRGDPYKDELDTLMRQAPQVTIVGPLRDQAEAGAPTLNQLQQSYDDIALKALSASKKAKASGPWSRIWANIAALISIRPANPQEGAGSAAILSRAEAALERQELGSVLSELASLDAAAREEFSPWVADARARYEGAQALSNISALLLREAESTGGGR